MHDADDNLGSAEEGDQHVVGHLADAVCRGCHAFSISMLIRWVISCRVGQDCMVPLRPTERAAAAVAMRTARLSGIPCARHPATQPQKTSPAPLVSTTFV